MKVYNKILENLRDSIKLKSLDDDTIEQVIDGKTVRLYKCDDCGNIFNEDYIVSVKTDMESLYGVGSYFPNHNYEYLSGCPSCNSIDISEIGLFELEDFEDYEIFKEGFTKWKHIYGPKYKYMDEKYEEQIMTKLIPMLRKYGLSMSQRPISDKPGSQKYIGRDAENESVGISFHSQHVDKENNRESKYDLLVKIYYKGNRVEAGVIDLNSPDTINKAFELITMTLEDLGVSLEGMEKPKTKDETKEPEERKEPNNDLDDLLAFRNSLREQELLEIEVNND